MEDAPTPFAELDQGPSKFEEFLEKNQKLLIGSSIAIFLGVLGYVGYSGYGDLKSAEGGNAFSAAEGESELQSVIANHGTTASAGAATILLANLQAEESSEKSIETLRNFVDTYPTHPALPSVTVGLGRQLLNEGKLTDAKAQLESVLEMENADYVTPLAQLALADIAKEEGDMAKAKELYTEVSNLSTDGPSDLQKHHHYKAIATSRLRFLEVVAPVEVEKKAAPAVAPIPEQKISTTVEQDDKNTADAE